MVGNPSSSSGSDSESDMGLEDGVDKQEDAPPVGEMAADAGAEEERQPVDRLAGENAFLFAQHARH